MASSSQVLVVGSVSHAIAILCTVFRLVYRGWTRRLWWEDAWAAFALILDGRISLHAALLRKPITESLSCLPGMDLDLRLRYISLAGSSQWFSPASAARMSIIFSIIRVANSSDSKTHRWITYLITASFACMWAVLLVQRSTVCIYMCQTTHTVAVSQLISQYLFLLCVLAMTLKLWAPAADVLADISLIIAPLQFWKNAGLSRTGKILILSVFSASLLITAITIPHSIMLFRSATETTLIFAQVKAALSLVICNLLVIVTLAYRMYWKETLDPDQSFASPGIFSSVIVTQFSINTISRASPSVQEEVTQDT
ncbi:hypothetical protein DFH29DRAFT_997541 [Suillus ampliporus]|nr:hypothetical protein DFH29DRAFT_997541 [Suillus ampliporus]